MAKVFTKNKFNKYTTNTQNYKKYLLRIFTYLVISAIGFIFLYPLLVLLSGSSKNIKDLANPMVNWIPSSFNFENYVNAFKVLGGWQTVLVSVFVMLLFAIAQMVSSAIIGYGFAKYDFWGKKFLFGLLIATFVLPVQTTFLPKYVLFSNFNMIGTIYPILLPSLFGQGLKSAIFILIFYQFFKMIPKSLDESAFIDGATNIKTFLSINMPMATPASVVVFVFSFVWNWNDTYLTDLYFAKNIVTLPLSLQRFVSNYEKLFPASEYAANPLLKINQSMIMAGTLLTIIPLILLYIVLERKLIESLDKSGITGE